MIHFESRQIIAANPLNNSISPTGLFSVSARGVADADSHQLLFGQGIVITRDAASYILTATSSANQEAVGQFNRATSLAHAINLIAPGLFNASVDNASRLHIESTDGSNFTIYDLNAPGAEIPGMVQALGIHIVKAVPDFS